MENQLVFVVVVTATPDMKEGIRKSMEHWRMNTEAAYASLIKVTEVGETR